MVAGAPGDEARDQQDFYDADVEYVMPPEWPEDRVYKGRESPQTAYFLLSVFEGQE